MTEDEILLIDLTAQLVSAFVGNNNIARAELPALIASTHAALGSLGEPPAPPEPERQEPAVSIRKSVTPDAIICLEDGKSFRSMKRHLRSAFDMSPEQYRAKWGLPLDYPMVAPSYAEARSKMARESGLGTKAGKKRPSKARSR